MTAGTVVVLGPRDRLVLLGAALWQVIAWGGRISLLTDAETSDWWNWFRIGGSLAAGLAVGLVGLGILRGARAARLAAWAYLVVGLITWSRSLLTVWTEPNSMGFRVVHMLLALVTWGLGLASVRVARRAPARVLSVRDPDGS